MTQIIKEGGKTIVKTGQRIDTLNAGVMTKDLVSLVVPGTQVREVNSLEFIQEIRKHLEQKLA